MATQVGQVYFDVTANTKGLTQGIAQGGQAFQGLGKMAGAAGAAIAAAMSIKAITSFTKSCIDMGSNLAEIQNVVDTSFGSMSNQIDDFADKAMTSAGLSETMAKKYAGTFGAMATSMGVTGQSAVDMSKSLTQLTGDVSSFYNISSDEAYTKLKSVFTGETEALKELGVVMTQTNLDTYAMANGFGKTTANMTEQEKVMLRYAYVTSALSNASGDFIRTQDQWANQTRILSLQWQQFKANLGQGFIAILSPILQGLNAILAKLVTVTSTFNGFIRKLTGKKASKENAVVNLGNQAISTASNIGGIGKAAQKTSKEIKRSLAGFDEINKLSDNSADSGGDLGGGAGGGGGGVADGGIGIGDEVASDEEKTSGALDKLWSKFTEIGGYIKEWANTYLVPVGESLKAMLDAFVAMVAALWNRIQPIVQPIIDFYMNMAQIFITMWTQQFQGLVDILTGIMDVITGLLNGDWSQIGEGIKNIIKGLCEFIWATISGAVQLIENLINSAISIILGVIQSFWDWFTNLMSPIVDWLGGLFLAAANGIMNAWGGITNFFGGIWENIKGIFSNVTGWFKSVFSNAWHSVIAVFSARGTVFGGIATGILEAFKAPVNALISGINNVVSIPFNGINNALNRIRNVDILGAKPFSGLIGAISVPRIPFLAQGGYVGANQPTLAMIGDNKHAGEIVAPEDKLLDIATKANNNGQVVQLLREMIGILSRDSGDIVMNVNGEQFARVSRKVNARYSRRYNNVGLE